MSNKILMIVNIFPPTADSGVQRPLKFLKYLAKDGWQTYVVTPKTPVNLNIKDYTLESEVPDSAKIFKTKSMGICDNNLTTARHDLSETSNPLKKLLWKIIKLVNDILFPIDKQIGWVPFALIKAIQVINRYKIKNIYITAFPFSAFLCGIFLKAIYGNRIFWVADYRDAWQFAPMIKKNVLSFRYRFICRMDEKFLRSADYVLFTSPHVLEYYVEKYPWLAGKVEFIANGYDEDDFVDVKPVKYDKFTFVYMGKIYDVKRNPILLLEAIEKYMSDDYQYLHVGIISNSVLKQINDRNLIHHMYLGFKSHQDAIAYSAGADVNILIKINEPDAEGPIPGKIYELLRIGKPILYFGPKQKFIIDLLTKTGAGVHANADNVDDIMVALSRLLSKEYKSNLRIQDIEQFSRKKLTERLESIYIKNSLS